MAENSQKTISYEEREYRAANGWVMLFVTIFIMLGGLALTIWGGVNSTEDEPAPMVIIGIIMIAIGWFPFVGLRIMRPNEALVLTLFGKYVGTLKREGFFFINPFCSAAGGGKLSLKTMTHNNEKQKINDLSGNPIEVGIVVTWPRGEHFQGYVQCAELQ